MVIGPSSVNRSMIFCLLIEFFKDCSQDFFFCWGTIAFRGVDCRSYEVRMSQDKCFHWKMNLKMRARVTNGDKKITARKHIAHRVTNKSPSFMLCS